MNFTLLDDNQLDNIEVLKKYGFKSAVTDFAILLGVALSNYDFTSEMDEYIGNDEENDMFKYRSGYYFLKGTNFSRTVLTINTDGEPEESDIKDRNNGIRPVAKFSELPRRVRERIRVVGEIKELDFGYYPQNVTSEKISKKLEKAYKNNSLKRTGKEYSTDSIFYDNIDTPFTLKKHREYEYMGKRYVRVIVDQNGEYENFSNRHLAVEGESYWLEVEPVTWLVDEKSDLIISKRILASGIQFNNKDIAYYKFEETDIKRFLNNFFRKEIGVDDILKIKENDNSRRKNPYDFDFSDVSEEEIIRGCVESDMPVFLHGRSSEGKSARVKELDPDATILYLRNVTPESLNGKSVYNANTGEMIDVEPTWYKKLVSKCESEPDKLHILFFDELTNALPSIQGMAFNIILDKEVNGIWQLPKNARIVAAGNDLEDSLAANQMAEPLFNRFAHVYIETTLDSWINWATTSREDNDKLPFKEKNKEKFIHSSIVAFLLFESSFGSNVLRTPYNGIKPNADPRKWEMASKVLYATGKPDMLRSLIGEELTAEFKEFTKTKVITLEDVLRGNYTKEDLEMNTSEIYMEAISLSKVQEKDYEKVRGFVEKLGNEALKLFDIMWANTDERLEKVALLKK